ncbi:MAG: molybdate ABC transporter substrate-binding protein [bacterium]
MTRARLSISLVVVLAVSVFTDASAETVRVFAAASLTEAFRDIAALYREQNPGDDVEFNFAGSQVLRTQIEQGAPADVFSPADRVHMDALTTKNLAASGAIFARNRLVVVTPRVTPKVRQLGDLARPGVRVVLADANVPVGRYTTQALGKMNRAGLFGDDFETRVVANVVSRETNVRAVLAKVSLDEVDAGVAYATDAQTAADKVHILEIPEIMNVVAEYPIAVVAKRAAAAGGARFVALVLSEPGQAILAKRGFAPPR